MNNQSQLKERLLKGVEYFWKLKPSELSFVEKARWTTFLMLLKAYLNGEKVVVKDLVEEAREIFK